MKSMKAQVQGFIKTYVASYKCHVNVHTDWGEPIVAFADAQDPLFLKLKEVVDFAHLLPSDLLADAKTVISYFIPFTTETVASNSKGKDASKQWVQSYTETNQLITDLNTALSEMFTNSSFKAATTLPTHNFDEEKLVSCWSQKHVAYVAGLGKFGLHHMIITEKGCCGRIGSIVTNAKIEPTQRIPAEFCLYKLDGSCGVCIKKCVSKALKADSLDKQACYKECLRNAKTYAALGLADVCGKCIAEIPCSFTNPSKAR
jgi:epoxyqueuosine reductase QueG